MAWVVGPGMADFRLSSRLGDTLTRLDSIATRPALLLYGIMSFTPSFSFSLGISFFHIFLFRPCLTFSLRHLLCFVSKLPGVVSHRMIDE